jgi:hypothetical protein
MIIHASPLILALIGFFLLILAGFSFWALRWLIGTAGILRSNKMAEQVEAAAARTERSANEIVAGVRKTAHEGAERIRDMGQEIAALLEAIRRLTPEDVRDAVLRLATIHAKEMTEKHRETAMEALRERGLYRQWLWALTGGPNDLSQVADKGYPADLPSDIAARLDALCAQRRISVKGRNFPRGNDGGFAR